MIFPVLKTEDVLQTNDKTRLDGVSTYITPGEAAITLIEIEPEAGAGLVDITTIKYLNWQYSASGDKVVTLSVTTDGIPVTTTKTITVIDPADDHLLSADNDLVEMESDILNWIRNGRSSFLDKHRVARDLVLDELDSAQIWKNNGTRYEAADIDKQEFKEWSRYLTLKVIYESNSNAVDDIFSQKAEKYKTMAISAKTRASYRLDYNQDGEIDEIDEKTENISGYIFRR